MCYYYATFYCVLMYTVGLRIIILYTFIKFSHLCRLLKTGNTSQWWLTVSSFGSLFVFVWLGQWASSCSLCFRTTTPPLLRTWSITETRASNSNFNLTEKWTLVPLTNTALGFFATWKFHTLFTAPWLENQTFQASFCPHPSPVFSCFLCSTPRLN